MNELVLLFVFSCAWTGGTGSGSLHPSLFFSPDDVADLRHKARTTHQQIFKRLREAAEEIKRHPDEHLPPTDWDEFASQWNERYGNDLGALAMYCVLEESDSEARRLAIVAMDTLSALPNWRVKASMRDDVPVAHSLVAMATAYDFLYGYLDPSRRANFLQKIKSVTKEMYKRSFKLWWGTTYIQNHVATNYVALFSAALVVVRHDSEATEWKRRAHLMLNRTMFLLSHVADGSLEEGVAYGSYTSRSLTQYVFLAERHLGLDLTDNEWLRQHFWFYYRTILPGYRETVGIADSNPNWFYGPESQLVFLDSFVMRSGHGNWLANRIRALRSEHEELRGSPSHRYTTLHTEFLFYDSTLPAIAPPHPGTPHLHVFSDWGVVTYGGGVMTSEARPGAAATFLSFKCGVLHGRAVNQMVRSPHSWVRGWRDFNPGHEHPDQGSFVFAPNGVPFITEALYGPKYTWLNNGLLFGPAQEPSCSAPYDGQIGECGKWIDFKNPQTWRAHGEVVTASAEPNGMVFMSGEMAKWYRSSLGLASVYRAVILLSGGVLLVVDHVEKTAESKTEYLSAFFHNRNAPFKVVTNSRAEIVLNGQRHVVAWSNSNHQETRVRSQDAEYAAEYGKRKTHYLNITSNLLNTHTRAAYVFFAPEHDVSKPRLEAEDPDVIKVFVQIDGVDFCVTLVTKHASPFARYHSLGFGGYASVRIAANSTIRFGVDNNVEELRRSRDQKRAQRLSRGVDVGMLLLLVVIPFLLVIAMYFSVVSFRCRRGLGRSRQSRVVFLALIVSWLLLSSSFVYKNYDRILPHLNHEQKPRTSPAIGTAGTRESSAPPSAGESFVPPIVAYTVFPAAFPSGPPVVLKQLFNNNTDFVQMTTASNPRNLRCRSVSAGDLCDFLNSSLDSSWLNHVLSHPDMLSQWKTRQRLVGYETLARLRSVPVVDNLVVLFLEDPEQMSIISPAGGPRLRSIVAVRDPRGWIESWFDGSTTDALRDTRLRYQMLSSLSFQDIDGFVSNSKGTLDSTRILAYLWKVQVRKYQAISSRFPLLIIRYEELLKRPTASGARIYRFLGLPYPPSVQHMLLQLTRTGTNPGGSVLSREQIRVIESMCREEMELMGYELSAWAKWSWHN